jgi:hypothetical protein
MSRSAVNRGIAEMEPLSPGRRRRLARSALLLVLLLVVGGSALWLRGRPQAAPTAAQPVAARPAQVDVAEAAADAERRLEERTWRLRVTTHPPAASLSIRAAGGATRRATTPFRGTLTGGTLELAVARPGYNRLVQRVTLDRHRSVDLWLDPKGLLHHKLGELRSGSNPKQVAFSPDGRELWVSLLGGRGVEVFDATTLRKRRAIRLGEHGAVEVLFTGGELQRIDLASGKARTLLHTGGAMRHLVGDREGERLYAGDMGTNEAFVVDLASERVRKLAATDNLPNTIDLTADGRVLYVSNRGRNGASYYLPGPEWGSVLAIDTASGKVLDAIVGGNQTTGLDVSADGRLLAFSDFLDNRIHVYAVPSYAALAAGGGGRAVAHRAELAKR